MSISAAFNSAISGLTAASRAAEIVSENIANAQTVGYARRSLNVGSNTVAPGVRILGVQRHADPGIIANRRQSESDYGAAETVAGFQTRYAGLVGNATDPGSISMRIADFETSLIEAASQPQSPQRLNTVTSRAKDLARGISAASEGLRTMRSQADNAIASQIDQLNQSLQSLKDINTKIASTSSSGGETAGLLDQRQKLIDGINQIVPVNVVERDHGKVALYTDGGAILLDGSAATLGFTPVRDTMPEMTIENGALSGLEINGIPVRTDSRNSTLKGGTLSAQFKIRDELAVSAQTDLDAVARDLMERFETPTLDPTTAAGDPGLFTDNGAIFDIANEVGLAGRLSLNSVVDPDQGGQSWRLRAGLGAGTPGEPGEARQLQAFTAILSERRTPGSTSFGTSQLTLVGIGSSLMSRAAQNANESDRVLSFAAASMTELTRIDLAQGVDTDAELQTLMLVEQAYAANARMIKVADEMMQTLLRI
ncbi:MAG: flagellar hook-associated protein FlgK [Rhodobacteraceae bacterium]|nr:MAG: flagellar hook-associated protein FlgK [Paracoccaceae bacterium]